MTEDFIPSNDRIAALYEALTQVRPNSEGLIWIERTGWLQCLLPGASSVYQNTIYLSVFPDGTPSAQIDAMVEAAIDEYRRRGLAFRWVLGPWTRPTDLRERLEARGLRLGRMVHGMTRALVPGEAIPESRVVVEQVKTGEEAEWARTYDEAWGLPVNLGPERLSSVARSIAGGVRSFHLARLEGVPAGVGIADRLRGSLYLHGSAVLSAFRGRGVFRALVENQCVAAVAGGRGMLTVYAFDDTSFPLLKRMGFEPVLETPQLFWEP